MQDKDLQALFDFLELKRGEKLGCSVCGWNEWTYLGGVAVPGRLDDGHYDFSKALEVLALQCQNCFQVIQFNRRLLDESPSRS